MSFLQLSVHHKELEIEGMACNCFLFNPITSWGLWGQKLNQWAALIQPEPFCGHTPLTWLSLPWAALQELGWRQGCPLTPSPALQGFNVNLVTTDRVSALHEACLGGHVACAKVLLEHGAQVRAGDATGDVGSWEPMLPTSMGMLDVLSMWRGQDAEMWKNITVFCFPGW